MNISPQKDIILPHKEKNICYTLKLKNGQCLTHKVLPASLIFSFWLDTSFSKQKLINLLLSFWSCYLKNKLDSSYGPFSSNQISQFQIIQAGLAYLYIYGIIHNKFLLHQNNILKVFTKSTFYHFFYGHLRLPTGFSL